MPIQNDYNNEQRNNLIKSIKTEQQKQEKFLD